MFGPKLVLGEAGIPEQHVYGLGTAADGDPPLYLFEFDQERVAFVRVV